MDKSEARAIVWSELLKIAKPDSRFHLDFGEYIPDFQGGQEATARLISLDIYQRSSVAFITPDNCLERLRAQAVRDGKVQIMPTYGIRRGLVELCPEDVPEGMEDYAVLLDVIETLGHHLSLDSLRRQHCVDLVVTGASVVSKGGIRFGKGHGFFDLEWAMLYPGFREVDRRMTDDRHVITQAQEIQLAVLVSRRWIEVKIFPGHDGQFRRFNYKPETQSLLTLPDGTQAVFQALPDDPRQEKIA